MRTSTTVRLAILVLTLLAQVGRSPGKPSSPESKTNLSVMQGLVETITKEVLQQSTFSRGDSILVQFDRVEDGWIVQDPFLGLLTASGFRVYSDAPASAFPGIDMNVSGIHLDVHYDDMFREGFMGTKKVKRTVGVSFSCRVTAARTREVLFSESLSESVADTVAVDNIRELELSSAKSTQAELPSAMFMDRVLEPFVIIGATGVAIYLFFHIRS